MELLLAGTMPDFRYRLTLFAVLILYAAWFCAMKADLFFPVRGRISIEISVAPLSLFPV
jgi:hypothetical protein